MHQNLRTTFLLTEQLLGVESKQKDHDSYLREMQLLIPKQQYNTFFVIYGKFTGSIDDDGLFEPKTCDLFLQNYSGQVTLGLVKIEEDIDVIFDDVLNEPVYLLKIHLKALHAQTQFDQPQVINIKNAPSLNNYTGNEAGTSDWTTALSGQKLDPKYLMRVLVYYDDLDTDHFNPNIDVNEVKFINSSKFKREGDQLLIKKYKLYDGNNHGKIFEPLGNIIREDSGIIETEICEPLYVQFKLQK